MQHTPLLNIEPHTDTGNHCSLIHTFTLTNTPMTLLTTDMFSFSSDFLVFLVFFLVDSVPSVVFFFLETDFFSEVSDTVSVC